MHGCLSVPETSFGQTTRTITGSHVQLRQHATLASERATLGYGPSKRPKSRGLELDEKKEIVGAFSYEIQT